MDNFIEHLQMASATSATSSSTWAPTILHKPNSIRGQVKLVGPAKLCKVGSVRLSQVNIATISRPSDKKRQLSKKQWTNLTSAEDAAEAKESIQTVSRSLGNKITNARISKGWKRINLAQAVSMKESEIGAWENGGAVFNPRILSKINRALGTQLSRE